MTPLEIMAKALFLAYEYDAQAALQALDAAGWAVVPKEATEAMVDRFVSRALQVSVAGEGGWSAYGRNQYKAMIEAGAHKV